MSNLPDGSRSRSRVLFSGLLQRSCGAAFVVVDRYHYGVSVCADSLQVARSTIESVLLADVKRELLWPEAFAASELAATGNSAPATCRAIRRTACPWRA